MTSDHDMLGMLRGVRKKLRRWDLRVAREQNARWQRYRELLDECWLRALITPEGYAWMANREHVIAKRWGCR